MENEDVIREKMEDTRTSLTEKLETLEQQVASTVQGATSNVAETVEAVKETVESLKESVQGTVEAVKDSVQGTVDAVKESVEDTISSVKESVHEGWTTVKDMLDIPSLVDNYPWAMVGGSIALGFVLEHLLSAPPKVHREPSRSRLPPDHFTGEDRFESTPKSTFAGMFKKFEPEINQLKGLALGGIMGVLREMVIKAAPENMADKLTEMFEGAAQKLGGEILPHHGNGKHHGNGRKPEQANT